MGLYVGITAVTSVSTVVNIPSATGVSTGSGVSAVVCIPDVEVVSCAAAGQPLLNYYCCCFVPGVSSVARVSAIAAFPNAAEVSSATGVSCCCWHLCCCGGSLLLWLPYCWWHTYCRLSFLCC